MRRLLLPVALALRVAVPVADAHVVATGPRIVTTHDLVRVHRTAPRAGRVALEQRTAAGWRRRATARAGRRFVLRWRAPAERTVVRLRVVSARAGVSRSWRMAVGDVKVVGARSVLEAPAPGHSGTLRIAGTTPRPGEFVAVGVGPATPAGFLGRITAA